MIDFSAMARMVARLRASRAQRGERGASVLEWAMIAAVVVVAATLIGSVVYNIVQDSSATLERCSDATSAC